MPDAQSYATHKRYVPLYHYVAFPLVLVNLVWAVRRLFLSPSLDAAVAVGTALALGLVTFFARAFATAAQDRVIRLEERMRLVRLAPELGARIEQLTVAQLVALRFASDQELPALARRVLDEPIRRPDAIKRAIVSWRPDDDRV